MIKFQSQRHDEDVVVTVRQHPIVMFPKLFIGFIMFLSPLLFLFIPLDTIFPGDVAGRFLMILTLLWYLFVFFLVFQAILSWYYNVYFVTNQRIVDIDFVGITHKQVSEASLRNIQDVTSRTRGFFQILFGLGTVHIQTAGTAPEFELQHIPNSEHVVREVGRLARIMKGKGYAGV